MTEQRIIGTITTIEYEAKREGTTLTVPPMTFNVVRIIKRWGKSRHPAYVTDQKHPDGSPLIISFDYISQYMPSPKN